MTTGHEFKVLRIRELPLNIPQCDAPDRIYAYWMANIATATWYNPEVEQLCVIHLNTRRRATGFHLVAMGTLDTLLCHPREVFRTAIMRSASAIVLAHNHPSGDAQPSEGDITVTRQLLRAGQLLKIAVLDHVIIGHADESGRHYRSLLELGHLS